MRKSELDFHLNKQTKKTMNKTRVRRASPAGQYSPTALQKCLRWLLLLLEHRRPWCPHSIIAVKDKGLHRKFQRFMFFNISLGFPILSYAGTSVGKSLTYCLTPAQAESHILDALGGLSGLDGLKSNKHLWQQCKFFLHGISPLFKTAHVRRNE